MANSKLSRMARIRAFCTTETYQQALNALKAESFQVPARDISLGEYRSIKHGGNSLVRECPWCGLEGLVDTRDDLLPFHLGPDAVWFCFVCQAVGAADEVVDCSSCGTPTTETDMELCDNCVSWKMG